MKYDATIDEMGGAIVLSCKGLGIKNIEYPYSIITKKGVAKTIMDYKYEQLDEDIEIDLYDIREEEDYQTKKIRESKEMKASNNSLQVPKF